MLIPARMMKHLKLLMLLILSTICTTVNTQQVEVNPIQNDQGFILFESGTINLPISFEHHCLTINVTQIENSFDLLLTQSHIFNKYPQIKYLMNKLEKQMAGIRITSRTKRGLFDFIGSSLKFLFGTLDEEDKKQFENQINIIAHNSIQANNLNDFINTFNQGINIINNQSKILEEEKQLNSLIFNIEHFTEYIEDIELSLQLTRLGIFNPKLLKHDQIDHINHEKLMNIKTSAWFSTLTNEIFIMSHIPLSNLETKTFQVIPYPDKNGQIINESVEGKFYLHNNFVSNSISKKIINDQCITNIIKHEIPVCTFNKYRKQEFIQIVEPNIIITWNLTRTKLNQNCNDLEIYIEKDKIIKIFNCTIELKNVKISNRAQQFTTIMFTEYNVTKIEPLSHIEIKEMIMYNNRVNNNYKYPIIMIVLILILIVIYNLVNKKIKTLFNIITQKFVKTHDTDISANAETDNIVIPVPLMYPELNA